MHACRMDLRFILEMPRPNIFYDLLFDQAELWVISDITAAKIMDPFKVLQKGSRRIFFIMVVNLYPEIPVYTFRISK